MIRGYAVPATALGTVLLLAALLAVPDAQAQAAQDRTLTAPDGTAVTIERDEWGVPRITAETESAAFYAQGFAAAQDRLFQMETFWRIATGRTAEITPEANRQQAVLTDRQIRTVFYTPEERQEQFEAMSDGIQAMVSSFAEGINAYIDLAESEPGTYLPLEYAVAPLNQIGIERWDVDKAMAVIQFFIRRFGEAGGQELQRLAELQQQGEEWFNENRPLNDPTAPTTIPDEAPPARPAVRDIYAGPWIRPAVAREAAELRERVDAALDEAGIPRSLGSYAAVIGPSMSASGNVLLLGAPQMGRPALTGPGATNRNVTWESEILVGSEEAPVLHISGMTVPGIPGVIIGRTRDLAWTFTSGVSDNVDTFIEQTEDASFGRYRFNDEWLEFETREETIRVLGGEDVTFTRYRTVHGPVYASDLENQQAFSYQYAFWDRELEMAEALYEVWQAGSVSEVETALRGFPVSFNFLLTHRDQTFAVWHLGRYPIRPGDPRLPLLGDGSQEWEGIVPFESLPQSRNAAQGYYLNWNNKPVAWWDHGDIMPWTEGAGRSYDGVLDLEAYITENAPLTFDEMKGLHAVADAREYPGSYQQIVEFGEVGSRAENIVPPGQSAFFNINQQPSPHINDQWEMYQTYEMKPFLFGTEGAVSTAPGAPVVELPALQGAFPNPVAQGSLRVTFALPEGGAARLEVIDLLGRTAAVLVDGEMAPGAHEADVSTAGLASGVYLLRLSAGGAVHTRKFTVTR